jgi:hypothetical protein
MISITKKKITSFFSKFWLLIVIPTVFLLFFFMSSNPQNKLDNFLEEKQVKLAREYINSSRFFNDNYDQKKNAEFKISCFMQANDSIDFLQYFIYSLIYNPNKEIYVQDNIAYLSLLSENLQKANPKSLKRGLKSLKKIKNITWAINFIWEELHKKALTDQTVSAWQNAFLACQKENERDEIVKNRRKIYLDTSLILKSGIVLEDVMKQNPCYIPLLKEVDRVNKKAYHLNDLYNPSFPKNNYLSSRFLVGDFNTVDENGNCRGSWDEFPENSQLKEFTMLLNILKSKKINSRDSKGIRNWLNSLSSSDKKKYSESILMWENYLSKVEQYRGAELKRDAIIRIGTTNYCIGQRMCLCEIQNDTIIMVAQFVTSSRNVNLPHSVLKDYDNQPRYYAPKCIITSRYWDKRIPYDEQDAKRDKLMGVGSNHVIRYKGSVALPNFLHMTPAPEFSRASAYCNGIHEFAVGGKTPGLYMGTPISLGCVRLHSYPSKFVRWWTPNNARLFIAYEYQNYLQNPKIK